MHLWEVKHPYYCSDRNYFAPGDGGGDRFPDWEAFCESWGAPPWVEDAVDMNLVFRWDWHSAERLNEDYDSDAYRHDRLELFFIIQRRGHFKPVKIERMDREREPEVRAFLEQHAAKLAELWAPLGVGVERGRS